MFKIIIVDDEEATRQGLISRIKWGSLGLVLAGEAENGLVGLVLAEKVKPDIILSDVRMPYMNGIDMVKEIRKTSSHCQIIFMSGFSDKEYLKSAIRLNAIDYVEKPLNMNEVSAVLEKTVAICRDENKARESVNELKRAAEKNIRILKNQLALALINRHFDAQEIRNKYDLPLLGLGLNDMYTCILIKINMHEIRRNNPDISSYDKDKLEDIVESFLEGIQGKTALGFLEKGIMVIFVDHKTEQSKRPLTQILRDLKKQINILYECERVTTVAVGKTVRGMENTNTSYQFAKNVLQKYFLYGCDNIFYLEEGVGLTEPVIDSKIYDYVKQLEYEKVLALLKDMADQWKQSNSTNINSIKLFLLNLMACLSSAMIDKGIMLEDKTRQYELDWAEILNHYTLDQVIEFIYEKMSMFSVDAGEQNGKSLKTINSMNYIRDHFNEPITINIIADSVQVTPSYLCRIFKKEMGMTVNEFMEEVRIEMAKKLIKKGNMKMQEVALKVGYNNANYFSVVFKKATGFYPSDYNRMGIQ